MRASADTQTSQQESKPKVQVAELVWKGFSYPIYIGRNIIGQGRKKTVSVALDHNSVSDKHASIFAELVDRKG